MYFNSLYMQPGAITISLQLITSIEVYMYCVNLIKNIVHASIIRIHDALEKYKLTWVYLTNQIFGWMLDKNEPPLPSPPPPKKMQQHFSINIIYFRIIQFCSVSYFHWLIIFWDCFYNFSILFSDEQRNQNF